jgi:protein-L-isoaspartate(D-aspartate) O-methyltransferase
MDYAIARRRMIDSQVRTNDVPNLRVQEAMERIPRETFLPGELRDQAYVEREHAYSPGRRMLTARDFSKLVAVADPHPGDLVLDIACGSGYSAAVLAALSEMVVAVESNSDLASTAQDNLSALDINNAAVIVGELKEGAPGQGPFDLIFIGAAVSKIPDGLFAQLKDGGRLATILREGGVSRGVIFTRNGEAVARRARFDARSSAILEGFETPKTFVF